MNANKDLDFIAWTLSIQDFNKRKEMVLTGFDDIELRHLVSCGLWMFCPVSRFDYLVIRPWLRLKSNLCAFWKDDLPCLALCVIGWLRDRNGLQAGRGLHTYLNARAA